jgi:hypothetical protein
MKFTYAKGSVAQTRHGAAQVGAAAALHLYRLTGNRFRSAITEDPGGRWLTTGSDRISRGNAHRTGGVRSGKRHTTPHESIQIWGVDVWITERGDRIKSLLVCHDEQNIWLMYKHGFEDGLRPQSYSSHPP